MDSYWPGQEGEYDAVTKAGGTFTAGPTARRTSQGRSPCFWGYLMPHKVLCGSGTEKAAPAVIRKLAKWLVAKGYDPEADDAVA